MKRLLLFLTFNTVCLFPFSSFSQAEIKVLSNGVVVHSSIGVEGVVLQAAQVNEIKPEAIETWTLDVCLQIREDVKNKLAEVTTQEEAVLYELKLKEVEEQILLLKSEK
jgi:hypothetical protein